MYWLGGYLVLQQGLDHPKIFPYHNIKLLSSWPMSDSNMLQSSLNSLQWCLWNVSIRLFLGEFRVFLWILLMERFLMSILYLTIIRYEHRSAEPQPVPFSLFVSLSILLVDRFLCLFTFKRCDLEVEPQLDDILQGDTLDAPHAPLYQTLKWRW